MSSGRFSFVCSIVLQHLLQVTKIGEVVFLSGHCTRKVNTQESTKNKSDSNTSLIAQQ